MEHVPSIDVTGLPNPLPEGLSVLDVREPVEWQHAHIEQAVHIPMGELPARLDELPSGRVLVVCRVGGRSAHATAYLQARGLDAVNLAGGMVEWTQAGRPVVSENGQPPRVV